MTKPAADGDLWCRRYHPAQHATTRLVCLPHAGGSASYFLPVASALSPEADVLAIQYPGRQDRRAEPPIDDISALADHVEALLRDQPPMPLILFGHSMGAIVAFEVTRRLEDHGYAPAHLFASGRRAPSTHRDESVHQRDDTGIIAEIGKLNGTSTALLGDNEMMRAALPALRADYRAIETYRCAPDVTVNCPISVLVGDSDPKTSHEEASAWVRHTTGAFDLQTFPGGHFYLTQQAGDVIAMLARHLRSVQSPSGSSGH
jgi:surfactin synthase thioesterase subunit